MNLPTLDNLICIGELKKPYGIKGWLWVFSHTEDRSAIFHMRPWWIETATGLTTLTVNEWREQGSGLVAAFAEIPNRNIAETMCGVKIWADKESLPKLSQDEYYWSDLIGLNVYNESGEYFGRIKELFETGAHAIIVVAPDKNSVDQEERLIPWHKQTVISVDLKEGMIVVAWQSDY